MRNMTSFGLSFDYRCPFTYTAHLNVLDGLADGADWDVQFLPFSLSQSHVADGESPIWERPEADSGLEALQVAVVIRDKFADAFPAVHRGIFELRHAKGQLLTRATISPVLAEADVDIDVVWAEVDAGGALETVRREHTDMVDRVKMWGVPAVVIGNQAAFIRITELSNGDGALARKRIDRVLELLTDFPELNEFKHMTLEH